MAVTQDIVATYRGPAAVIRRLLSAGQREDRALAILMAACALVFISQMPRLSREAHLSGQELNMLLGGTLLAWLIIAPLILYGVAALSHLVARIAGGRGSWYGARLALFWALLASAPLLLLHGLLAGFVGPGPALSGVGILWLVVFGWFWFSGLRQAERPAE
ncbi:YIP1 family protein [Lutimaribacter marinistellae]|uniref:YIP1 family protein n=1 Tax=Lutimaribacter marinistellae TaxID=1820329 RepID=A0ABV7TNI1_9RHOB